MIYAIASVMPYRRGDHPQHPAGYYMSALRYLDRQFLTRGFRSVEDILLICRYGIYENIGTSIWDLLRLGGRLCVELELNAHDGPPDLPLIEKQHRRRVFWKFYLLDRYSSTTLDRPFAIDDADIQIKLPLDIDDSDLEALEGHHQNLDEIVDTHPRDPSIPTETTVFIATIKLRLVSSHIHTEFCKLREECLAPSQLHLTIGRIYVVLNQLLEDLKAWRDSAPSIAEPTCIYHTKDWLNLLYAREKLYLIRRAIDLVHRRNGVLPRHFSTLLLHAALDVIKRYSSMVQSSFPVTHTRNYFHIMFTAGLSVIYCIASKAALTYQDLLSSAHCLQTCETTLTAMGIKMQHSHPYVTVFAALHRDVAREIQKTLQNSIESSQPTTMVSSPNHQHHHHPDHLPRDSATNKDQTQTQTQDLDVEGHEPGNNTNGGGTTTFAPQVHLPDNLRFPSDRANDSLAEVFSNCHNVTNTTMQYSMPGLVPPGFPQGGGALDNEGVPAATTTATLGCQEEGIGSSHEDLQGLAFTNDEFLWDMDTMLWEYVYGDSHLTPFLSNPYPGHI